MAIRYIFAPVNFTLERTKTIDFSIPKIRTILVEFSTINVSRDTRVHYAGEYVITPRVFQQSMDTDHKIMDDNVTILEIPSAFVENPTGGYTVSIG